MAEDRLPWLRPPSIVATKSDSVMFRAAEMSLRPCQNASSRLTLVLCPAMTMERLTTGDFIDRPPYPSDARRVGAAACPKGPPRAHAPTWVARTLCDSPRRESRSGAVLPLSGLCED